MATGAHSKSLSFQVLFGFHQKVLENIYIEKDGWLVSLGA